MSEQFDASIQEESTNTLLNTANKMLVRQLHEKMISALSDITNQTAQQKITPNLVANIKDKLSASCQQWVGEIEQAKLDGIDTTFYYALGKNYAIFKSIAEFFKCLKYDNVDLSGKTISIFVDYGTYGHTSHLYQRKMIMRKLLQNNHLNCSLELIDGKLDSDLGKSVVSYYEKTINSFVYRDRGVDDTELSFIFVANSPPTPTNINFGIPLYRQEDSRLKRE